MAGVGSRRPLLADGQPRAESRTRRPAGERSGRGGGGGAVCRGGCLWRGWGQPGAGVGVLHRGTRWAGGRARHLIAVAWSLSPAVRGKSTWPVAASQLSHSQDIWTECCPSAEPGAAPGLPVQLNTCCGMADGVSDLHTGTGRWGSQAGPSLVWAAGGCGRLPSGIAAAGPRLSLCCCSARFCLGGPGLLFPHAGHRGADWRRARCWAVPWAVGMASSVQWTL